MAEIIYNNLTNDNEKVTNNDNLKIELKEHQKTAIHAMLEFENNGKIILKNRNYNGYTNQDIEIESNYGILADKVGSGKTIMIVGLIVNRLIPNNKNKFLQSSNFSIIKFIDNNIVIKTNMIVIPHNLITQWQKEFSLSNLNVLIINDKKTINKIEYLLLADDVNNLFTIEYYDVIIISCTMYKDFIEKINNFNIGFKWSRIIIDEINTIKLPTKFYYNCNFIWYITATPERLNYTKKMFLKDVMYNTSEIILNNVLVQNNNDFVDMSNCLPDIKYVTINCYTPRQYKLINKYVSKNIMDMLNAGNVQEAITKLNCNVKTSDNILDVLTNKLQNDLHNKKMELDYEKNIITSNINEHNDKLACLENTIDKMQGKINDLTNRIKQYKESNCPICFDEIENPIITNCCNNTFCIICLAKCKKCPLCRNDLKLSDCTVINENINKSTTKENKKRKLCTKNNILVTIIKKKPNGKFIIVSNYDGTFNEIENLLNQNKISHSKIIGTNKTIDNTINKFKNNEIQVLMLNSSNYGSGLNLEMTTDIIIYHQLTKNLEIQVIGRAQRPVRNQSLNVYYLLHDNEQNNIPTSIKSYDINVYTDDKKSLNDYINNN